MLTPAQQAAVTRAGQDVCVLAGPGSGKTRVLAERFHWLVTAQGVSPRNILAITFTEKAAAEIRHRVAAQTMHPEIDFAPISTLHSLCTRILREFSIAAGLDPAATIWEEHEAKAALRLAVEDVLNEAAGQERAQLRRLFTVWNSDNIVDDLCQVHQKVRALSPDFPQPEPPPDFPGLLDQFHTMAEAVLALPALKPKAIAFRENFSTALELFKRLGPEPTWRHIAAFDQFPKRQHLPQDMRDVSGELYEQFNLLKAVIVSGLTNPERNFLVTLLNRVAARYALSKRSAVKLDFNDLEHLTLQLLKTQTRIREELQRRFEHILMDEMQDTNPMQWEVLNLLRSPGAFFAVGDINQSIYGFRYAAPELFHAYRDGIVASGGEVDVLAANFRSRAEILDFTAAICRDQPGIELPQLTAGRRFRSGNVPVSVHPFANLDEECAWLAREIQELLDTFAVEPKQGAELRRLRLSDIAVVVRTSQRAESIAAELSAAGIPYTLSGGRRFFDTQEVADLLCYLHLLANPLNTIARTAVFRSPFGALSDAQIYAGETNPKLEALISAHRARQDTVSPEIFLREALDLSGYSNHPEPGVRANIEKFLRLVREAWQASPLNMPAFVEHLESLRAAADEESAPIPSQGDAVSILTVHAAKGLEFPVVFVAGCYFSVPGNHSSLSYGAAGQLGMRFTNPEDGKLYPDLGSFLISQAAKRQDEEELARTLYVALTRAEQKLYVSWGGGQRRGWLKFLQAQETPPYAGEITLPPPAIPEAPRPESKVLVPLGPREPGLSAAAPSHLALYAECPQRYFLDHVLGLKPVSTGAANLGTEVHQLLAEQIEAASPQAAALAARARQSPLAALLADARQLEREYDFVFAHAGIVWEGVIDLWLETSSGEIVVVDYKTGQRRDGVYDLQLALYREALRVRFPTRTIRSYLLYLATGDWVEVDAPIPADLLDRFSRGIDFSMQPGQQCERCPHWRRACPGK